jgi:putative Holliday junction resolvase
MARIVAIDYGFKRVGIAVTDEMQLIASGLTTVDTPVLFDFLTTYFTNEKVEKIIVGEPKQMDGTPSESAEMIEKFINKFRTQFPEIPVFRVDERFTSKMAFQTMISSGLKKKQRQNKALIDEIAATIILQDYMNSKAF